ncbi:TatD family hydrolase [Candidatus Babeliales bacterium]|nr:TatD family hydrolase [Candidatus Babeliales bacterium]
MFIDTHCHINMMVKKEFDAPLTQKNVDLASSVVQDAHHKHVMKIINIGTSVPESKNCILLANTFPSVYATVALHPNDCTTRWMEDFNILRKMVAQKEKNQIVAIGECGLDYHYHDHDKQRQHYAFHAHIELALEHQLPVVIHTRDAIEETLKILEQYTPDIRGVVHCFSEDLAIAREIIAWGLYIGIGGAVTYPKNEILQTVAREIPLQKILLETDAPFLPPQQYRGKQNHPKYIPLIGDFIAQLRRISSEEIAQVTTCQAEQLFKI